MMITYLLRLYRKERKVTVRSLAKEIGIKHTTLWRFENGRGIESPSLARIINWVFSSPMG
jgi:transcriptional regulator with XRE-family HTH domain